MASSIPEHKVVLCGEYGVGKTSIFRRYVDNSFIDVINQPTLGTDNFGKCFREGDQDIKDACAQGYTYHFKKWLVADRYNCFCPSRYFRFFQNWQVNIKRIFLHDLGREICIKSRSEFPGSDDTNVIACQKQGQDVSAHELALISLITVTLWDTAGIERFVTMSQAYYRGASAAILCYSMDDRDSFNILSQYILDIVVHTETAKIFLCGNKYDLAQGDEITESDIESFQLQCDTVLSGMYQISCKSGYGVEDMFRDIARTVMESVSPYEKKSFQLPETESSVEPKSRGCCSGP